MAWSQTDLDNLEKAIALGTRRVKYSDKEVEYNSFADMMKARDAIRKELGLIDAAHKRIYSEHTKGAR